MYLVYYFVALLGHAGIATGLDEVCSHLAARDFAVERATAESATITDALGVAIVLTAKSEQGTTMLMAAGTDGQPLAKAVPCAMPIALSALDSLASAWLALAGEVKRRDEAQVGRYQAEAHSELLLSIGRALSQERDVNRLLEMILARAREVTNADAGSVYIVEGKESAGKGRTLRFVHAQNDTVSVESKDFTIPVSPKSIVGACVLAKQVIEIDDLYQLDPPGQGNNPWGFVHDRSFDVRNSYYTHSMLAVPMISAREEVLGVIQLMNRRKSGVFRLQAGAELTGEITRFDESAQRFVQALVSQAGIALENAVLYNEVKLLFDGFVRASVSAIEARDPTTFGHSERVAQLTVDLAKVADRESSGPYRTFRLIGDDVKEIEYAALLHDFGKVGVRENVLVKAQKLYEHERQIIETRFDLIRACLRNENLRKRVDLASRLGPDLSLRHATELDTELAAKMQELDRFLEVILQSNQPSVLASQSLELLGEIAQRTFERPNGELAKYLSERELATLRIARGSLTEAERSEIESHVVHTNTFLSLIPWGENLCRVPEYASRHHEKLNGTGYPHGLVGDEIPPVARMMTIADIFDALTAKDRPYKRAVPVAKALDIISQDVKSGQLDAELFRMFLESKLWQPFDQA